MKIRPMTQSDVEYLKNHSISRGIFDKMPEEIDVSVAIEEKGIVLAIGGLQMINCTTAWAWLDMSAEAGNHIIIVYRVIREWLDEMTVKMGIKRLQAYVEQGFEEGHRMVNHLGFEWESVMECFVGEKNADMYRRLA